MRSAPGGLMVMDRDHTVMGLEKLEEKVVTERPPTEKGVAGPALRVAGGEARQVERHRVRLHRPHHRDRGRTDEPGRFLSHRGVEGGGSRALLSKAA